MRSYLLLCLFVVVSLLVVLPVAAVAQDQATVEIQPPASLPGEGQTFTTDVAVKGVKDLLGFQFDIYFDPAQLAVESIALGPFIGSTGRSAQPLGPDTRDAASGRIVYGGFTLGKPDQPGAAGDGVLATITWRVVKPADFSAALGRIQLAGPGGQALPVVQPEVTAPAVASAAQPVATAAAATGEAAEPAASAGGLPTWALILVVVVIVVVAIVAVLLARRRGAKPVS